jgi:molybdenum cofactor cytidylyltransferase
MGGGKLLAPFRGRPLLFYGLESARAACSRVIVVTGFDAEHVTAAVLSADATKDPGVASQSGSRDQRAAAPLEIVHNPGFRHGMFSSIKAGARAVRSPWFFVLPGDLPLVRPASFEAVAAELARLRRMADAIVPVVSGTRGHPVLIRADLVPALLAAAPDAGPMRRFLRSYRVHRFEHDDAGMVRDVDTREALDELTGTGPD